VQPLNRNLPAKVKRDPAPSRWAYRWQRLWLTPRFRRALRHSVLVVPLAFLAILAVFHAPTQERLFSAWETARLAVEERPEFSLTMARIDGVPSDLAHDIRESLPLDFPVSSFDVNLEDLRESIEGLDAVRAAKLSILKDNILLIEATPRVPAALVRLGDSLELRDADGALVAEGVSRGDHPNLPLIAGEGAADAVGEAQALFASAQPLGADLLGFVRVGERRWDVVLRSGQRILLPEDDAARALERVLFFDNAQELLSRDVAVIDMRLGARPTLRLGKDALKALQLSGYSE